MNPDVVASYSDQRSLPQEQFLFGFDSVNQIETPAQKYAGVLILVSGIVAGANGIGIPKIGVVTSAENSSIQVLKTDEFSSLKICQEICQEKVKWV